MRTLFITVMHQQGPLVHPQGEHLPRCQGQQRFDAASTWSWVQRVGLWWHLCSWGLNEVKRNRILKLWQGLKWCFRAHVHLNDEMLANLAIWEPRTFRALAGIAAFKAMQPSESGGMNIQPCGPEMDVIMRWLYQQSHYLVFAYVYSNCSAC